MTPIRMYWPIGLTVVLCSGCSASEDSPQANDPAPDGGTDAAQDALVTADVYTTEASADATNPAGDAAILYKTCSFVAACLDDSRIGLYANKCFEDLSIYLTRSADPEKQYGRLIDCAATSTTCSEFVACDRLGATYDCKSPSDSACVGNAFVDCLSSSQIRSVTDCASATGMSCVAGQGCQTATECPVGDGSSSCDGNTLVECEYKAEGSTVMQMRHDCPTGSSCTLVTAYPGMPAIAVCARNTTAVASCAQPYACEGSTLVACGSGLESRIDCAAVDQACTATPYGACVAAATECVPRLSQGQPADAYADNCDGATMKTCMNGRLVSIDCASLGHTGSCGIVTTAAGDNRAICH